MSFPYFIKVFEASLKQRWNEPALDEFKVSSLTYGEFAERIFKNHLLFELLGLSKGDKIALNAKSSARWAEIFFSAVSGGFTTVQLFNGFTPSDIQGLTNHSESKILYTERALFSKMKFEQMPGLIAAIDIKTGEILAHRIATVGGASSATAAGGNYSEGGANCSAAGDCASFSEVLYAQVERMFKQAFPLGLKPEMMVFEDRSLDDICAIMYTSGSTGNPKGVMISVRNISANIDLIPKVFPYKSGESYVSVLPYAHIFGMVYDMIMPLCIGMHLCVLGLPPVPSNLKPAMREYRPSLFFAVPLILNKMIESSIGEFLHTKGGEAKLEDYENNPDFCEALKIIFMQAFGGNIKLFVTGGAAIPSHLEELLALKLRVPFVTGYGMTEAAPTITLGNPGAYKLKSVGAPQRPWVDLRIDSTDPHNVAGEVLIKGDVVFSGYYKAPEATAAVMTKEGWFRTGDIGIIDNDDVVFLMGRCKNMILTDNGQNIFPEEIEVRLNAFPYVGESIIVERRGRLYALIVPDADYAAADNLNADALAAAMERNIEVLNAQVPAYCKVCGFELRFEPFAKTPKGSIKRFMYS